MANQTNLQVYKRLLTYVKPYWFIFLISIVGYLIYASTQPMFAWLMKFLVESIENKTRETAQWIPFVIVGVVLLRGVGSFLGNYFLAKVSNNIVHTLRCKIFDRYTELPNTYFDDRNSGHLVSRVTYNVSLVTGAATDALKVVVREGLTVIGLLGYLIYMNWQLSLVFLALAPVIGIIVRTAGKRFKKISKKIQASMGDVTHVSSELINGYRVVRSFGGEEYEKNRFFQASHTNLRQSLRLVKTSSIHTPLLQLIVTIGLAVLVYLALILMDDASAGDFIAYITAALLVPKPVRQLSEVGVNIQKGIAAAESIFEVLDEKKEEDNGSYETERAKGKLEFENLSFAYPGTDKQVLKSVTFTAEPGKTVALVGYSGSGKTTLASLVPRFYDFSEGRILLDGVDIREYTLKNLRRQIALVTQHVTLFNDTVERNIAYGSMAGIDRKKVIEAAEAANAMEFIEELPNGLDTLVGENGIKLSGGQRQRLAIARALLKDAPLLILDEATSALDTESERKIQFALENVMTGRTTLVIAHRLSTIENADLILAMDKGRIVEMGNHAELIKKDGYYAKLHQTQVQRHSEFINEI
ncbi:MAG: lipid A export permease/ATP-binding protein MsbA [Gammaproteobacteria bacterium]